MATDNASKVEAVAPSLQCVTPGGDTSVNPIKDEGGSLAIVVLGASGDLAKKKTFPALFALFKQVSCTSSATQYLRGNSKCGEVRTKRVVSSHGCCTNMCPLTLPWLHLHADERF